MSAHATQSYDGFAIDERRLRKLVDIIESRLRAAELSNDLVFVVYRSDHAKFATQSLSAVLQEENAPSAKLVGFELSLTPDTPISVRLSFRDDQGASLLVEGEDRDLVFLLYSDVKAYIEAEIQRRPSFFRYLTTTPVFVLSLFVFMAIFPFLSGLLPTEFNRIEREHDQKMGQYVIDKKAHEAILDEAKKELRRVKSDTLVSLKDALPAIEMRTSEDVSRVVITNIKRQIDIEDAEAKVQAIKDAVPKYLTWKRSDGFKVNTSLTILIYGVLATLILVARYVIGRLEERYLFLIGNEIQAYQLRQSRREKVLWGIGISFVVSVLASIAATLVWPPK